MRNLVMLHVVLVLLLASAGTVAQETEIVYLSGQGKDDPVEWEFYCTGGRQSGYWTTIPVPSCWEFQGFGTYNYGFAYGLDMPRADEQGRYRLSFTVPASWSGKKVHIVFEGSMTDTEVWVNGQSAGPKHQGAFYRFRYDITGLLKYGASNLLEVAVDKESSNESINIAERKADYWVFGGLFRPVYLEAYPAQFIERTAIDAKADGAFSIDVYLKDVTDARHVIAYILRPDGSTMAGPFSRPIYPGLDSTRLSTKVSGHRTWSAETPDLYHVKVSLMKGAAVIHTVTERFGFRTVEVREGDGVYVNGQRIMMKGVNRHSFWPDSGRTLSPALSVQDIKLMKEMNMNAVRMSHYPPDAHFLDACDELGLYVLDELAGWQKPPYDTETGKRLVKEMVPRDVNHPSILFWDNGNEGGWNTDLDDEFAKYDPQNRNVLHPWELFGGINTDHYEPYESVQEILSGSDLYMPTEFLHGLYDGGHGAGLNDYWNLLTQSPLGAGGFLWVFSDEGAVRTDKNGWIDTDGNHAPDGIVGPYREKEGSFYTIKEIWSPVHIGLETLPAGFTGSIEVENRYDFTNLDQCSFEWKLVNFKKPHKRGAGYRVATRGDAVVPSVGPHGRGELKLDLPGSWRQHDALYLTATDPQGHELWTWTWMIEKPAAFRDAIVKTKDRETKAREDEERLYITAKGVEFAFCKKSGTLIHVERKGRVIPFGHGPRLVCWASDLADATVEPVVTHYQQDNSHVVDVRNAHEFDSIRWTVYGNGWIRLDYQYELFGEQHFMGITFDYPEENVKGMKWLGKGPYRVWKNRLKGTTFNVWSNDYNDTTPGISWDYPEFKGYYADLHWVVFDTTDGPITAVTDSPDIFLRVYTQKDGPEPRDTVMKFPEGDISFLHAIPAIGTKFNKAEEYGPESQPTNAAGKYAGTIYLRFGMK